MAFFKFRVPGQADPDAPVAEVAVSTASENIDIVRRRARHRLMGAVVLVLVAVLGFPLLFDTQPRPVAVDTPIVIPDRHSTPALTAAAPVSTVAPEAPVTSASPVAPVPVKPSVNESKPLPVQAGLDEREEVVVRSAPVVSAKPAPAPVPVDVKPAQAKPVEPKPVPAKTDPVPPAKPQPKDDGSKAKSLLDGRDNPAVVQRHVIQVGAFSDASRVREVRKKLEQGGLATYTQSVEDKEGKTSTRVRVGPFDSRDEADRVAERIRKLGFSPAVLRI
ncbi:MAG: SPOR domain-containing protein [Comamonadaceae bacterium PBBC1]|nr:MAG: SPOR domain-containing protein [Comamonadaceae bacterium PBBC1]